jgi:serine/threonine-protein kinase
MTSPRDPLEQSAEHRVGTVLNHKWHLDTLLGVGGMAAVYAATHRNGKRVAVKMLHAAHAANTDVRGRFLREGYVANRVQHDGAVSVLDDDTTEDGTAFLVMELLEGESLEATRLQRGGRLPEADVLAVSDQVLDVLGAAHEKGIVHRDVKPENIFVTRAGSIKVLDFGIARVRELSPRSHGTQDALLGTPAFMPPEQARGRWDQVDATTDVWAVGAMMFTLLCGRTVHQAETLNELLLAAMTHPAPPVRSILPSLLPATASTIDRALAFEKADRWPNARAMQQAVRAARSEAERRQGDASRFSSARVAFAVGSGAASVQPPEPAAVTTASPVSDGQAKASTAKASRTLVVALVAIALAAALAVPFVMRQRRAPSPPSDLAPMATTGAGSGATAPATQIASTASAEPPMAAADPAASPPAAQSAGSARSASPAPRVPSSAVGRPQAPPAGAPRKPNCDTPFEYDQKGVKHWKVECL